MSLRLDTQALIKIVGKEKLLEELTKNIYIYLEIQKTADGRLDVDYSESFDTDGANPIEWLIFNSKRAIWMIYSAISDYGAGGRLIKIILKSAENLGMKIDERIDYDENDNYSIAEAYLLSVSDSGPDVEMPYLWCETLWNNVRKIPKGEFAIFLQGERPAIAILNSKNESIFGRFIDWSTVKGKVADL